MATWGMTNLQDANSPTMEYLTTFHDNALVILSMILTMVIYMMIMTTFNKNSSRVYLDNQTIEMIWTVMPAGVLVLVALPSLQLLYMMDELDKPSITLKSIGNQWYWMYEYTDFYQIHLESYMKPTSELENNEFRLIEVDNRVILPVNAQIRILVTSSDVIHSWTIPCIGVKIDGTPGRLNQGSFMINRPGLMYGQCSEICGANHSFMPIVIESVTANQFIEWLKSN